MDKAFIECMQAYCDDGRAVLLVICVLFIKHVYKLYTVVQETGHYRLLCQAVLFALTLPNSDQIYSHDTVLEYDMCYDMTRCCLSACHKSEFV